MVAGDAEDAGLLGLVDEVDRVVRRVGGERGAEVPYVGDRLVGETRVGGRTGQPVADALRVGRAPRHWARGRGAVGVQQAGLFGEDHIGALGDGGQRVDGGPHAGGVVAEERLRGDGAVDEFGPVWGLDADEVAGDRCRVGQLPHLDAVLGNTEHFRGLGFDDQAPEPVAEVRVVGGEGVIDLETLG